MMMMVVIVMILIMLTNLPHSKESPCMKRTTGMGAVLISPEAGTYTFRYRQSSDWLLGFAKRVNGGDALVKASWWKTTGGTVALGWQA